MRISTDEELWIRQRCGATQQQRKQATMAGFGAYRMTTLILRPTLPFIPKLGHEATTHNHTQWYCKITNLKINPRWNHLRAYQQCEMCHEAQDLQ
jgi:hypothetical protein